VTTDSEPGRAGGLAADDAVEGAGPDTCTAELVEGRTTRLGDGIRIRRLLPTRRRTTIGAWCFLDEMGPVDVGSERPVRVPPHPHIGLQTVTWLVEGELLHRDTLGVEQRIRPGQLNLMTSGRGIAHSEETPDGAPPRLHGAQLWTALPAAAAGVVPDFEHHAELPELHLDGIDVTVLVGAVAGATSPARTFSPLVGAQLRAAGATATELEVDPTFEHGVVVLRGAATVADHDLAPGTLLYLGPGPASLPVATHEDTVLLLIGGEPYPDPLVMWWNFVAADAGSVTAAREDWESGRRFGTVPGFDGAPVPAPDLPPGRLRPR
jgi:quercetin 2,3-dioxygenase